MHGARVVLLGGAALLVTLVLLTPTSAAQDANLVVTDLGPSPADPSAGEAVRFPVTVENQGDTASEPFTVRWTLDGSETLDEKQTDALAAGENVTLLSRNWTATAGDHKIRATADIFDRTPESDETDNVLQATFTVAESTGARGPVEVLETTLPAPREGASAVAHDGAIHLLGGVNGTTVEGNDPTEILAFDPADRTVTPTNVTTQKPFRDAAAVATSDRVLVVGGTGTGGLRDTVLSYDPAAGAVTQANITLPEPRCCGDAVWNGTHVLLVGGRTPSGPTDTILAWEPGANTTTRLDARLPAARVHHQVVWDGRDLDRAGCPDGCAYVLGGADAAGDPLRSIVRFNPTEGDVSTVSGRLPANGSVDGSATWSGRHAYVLGGRNAPDHLRQVVRYDTVIDIVDVRHALLPTGRHATAAAWTADANWIFGGRHQATLDEVVRYEPGKPDLAVSDLKLSPQDPSVGTDVRLRATVDNVGVVPAGNFTVRFLVDGDPVSTATVGGLDVGRSLRLSSEPWTATAGPHTATVTTVLTGPGGEVRVDNNRAALDFTVNEPPIPSFETATDELTVSVNATASQDPDGAVAEYTWIWGDGIRTTGGPLNNHTYESSGNYTIILEVVDDRGDSSQTSRPVTPNRPPEPSFTVSVSSQTVEVDASPSSDPDGDRLVSYLWKWGDNTTLGSGLRANHTYEEIGIYTITLNVRDDLGASATTSKELEVWGPIPGPGPALALAAALAAGLAARRRRGTG